MRARITLAFVAFAAAVAVFLDGWTMQALWITLGGIGVGLFVAWWVLRPVQEIGTVVDLYDPDELADELAHRRFNREVGSLAARLEFAMRRVAEGMKRQDKFTRYASHELRTPVSVIRGASELLRATADLDDPLVRRPLERIERSVLEMEALIEAFLWLAHDHGEPGTAQACEVAPIVRETLAKYSYLIDDKPVRSELVIVGEPAVHAPPTVISVVLGNLIANAFHYTDDGKVVIEVGPNHVSVTDSGGGIELDDPDSCSKSFVQGEKSVGYGIGLAIVHSLVDRFGWWLELESEPGVGTTATLRF